MLGTDAQIEQWISMACDDGFEQATEFALEDDDAPPGPPLQDDELLSAHNRLAKRHSPSDFQAAVKALHRRSSSKIIFNNPRHKFLLDAWTLAELRFALRTLRK
jgi:hypothetical protein